jgi:hypothetical protein
MSAIRFNQLLDNKGRLGITVSQSKILERWLKKHFQESYQLPVPISGRYAAPRAHGQQAVRFSIIATPILEFEEDGGLGGGPRPGLASRVSWATSQAWRREREYARGGRITSPADVGQRYSGGAFAWSMAPLAST